MSGLTPNSTNIALVKGPVAIANQLVVHPEYQYWKPEWQKIRDCLAGQREIKRKGKLYLPAMKGADKDDYLQYISRAVFFNMTGQTQAGILGQVFRRDPKVDGLPKKYDPKIGVQRDDQKFVDALQNSFTKDNASHLMMAKTVIAEQIAMGRFGVLVDAPAQATKSPDSFVIGYTTENILDWSVANINGRYVLTRVLLREFVRKTNARYFSPYTYDALYRELLLTEDDTGTSDTGYKYVQNVFIDQAPNAPLTGPASSPNFSPQANAGIDTRAENPVASAGAKRRTLQERIMPLETVTPTIRGKVLGYIPFVFFGAAGNQSDVEKPPLLEIADLNISHYRTYAELEYGRFYTALPVYYMPGSIDEGAPQYNIGPNTVWEVPEGQTPGILEFTGQGLKALETALETKQDHISAIGGRLAPGMKGSGQNESETNMKTANEYSLLLNVIEACNDGMTWVMRYWLAWRDVPLAQTTGLRYQINTDFLSPNIGARELRAIQMMYEAGVVTVDVLYDYLRKADVIRPEISIEEFKATLDDPKSFINQPDVSAMQRGFANREQELEQERIDEMRGDNEDAGLLPGGKPKPNKDGSPGSITPPTPPPGHPPVGGDGKLPPQGPPGLVPTGIPGGAVGITKVPKNPAQTPKKPVSSGPGSGSGA